MKTMIISYTVVVSDDETSESLVSWAGSMVPTVEFKGAPYILQLDSIAEKRQKPAMHKYRK